MSSYYYYFSKRGSSQINCKKVLKPYDFSLVVPLEPQAKLYMSLGPDKKMRSFF